jgi:hypothetical protein
VFESELSTTNLNVATEPPIDHEAEAARPEGMTDDEWSNICNLTLALRLTSISLWINMRKREGSSDPPVKSDPSVKPKTIPSLQDLFPLCPDSQRAIPNVFLRSAIFSATQGKTRRLMNNELVPSQGGYEVRISTVESLEQSDLDVWLQSVHLARCSPLGTACEIKAYPFLEGLGRSNKGRGNYRWLKDSLRRLQNTLIEFKAGSIWIRFNLINQTIGNEETKNIVLQFDPLLMKLFVPDSWTALWWQQRLQLKRKALALWLHGYYASHAEPYPVKVETLMKLCGSGAKDKKHYKESLKVALEQLKKVSGIITMIDEDDLVIAKKPPSPSQARHLIKKMTPKNGSR